MGVISYEHLPLRMELNETAEIKRIYNYIMFREIRVCTDIVFQTIHVVTSLPVASLCDVVALGVRVGGHHDQGKAG